VLRTAVGTYRQGPANVNASPLLLVLLGTGALTFAGPALASDPGAPDPPTTDELAAKADLLQAQVEALQAQLNELKAQMARVTPSWKGAPQVADADAGWSFKPRGYVQFETAYVENPDDAIETRTLGFNARARRVRLGAEGTIPGGFGYKVEVDFANSAVSFADAILTYAQENSPFSAIIGNHQTWQGLEQVSSSRFLSFLERAQMNDAFTHARRLGISLGAHDKANVLRLNAGIFTAHSIDASFDNDGWIAAGRATFSPHALGGTLHLGANYEHRRYQSNNSGPGQSPAINAPSVNQSARFRARPFLQTTDVRFVDTTTFAAKSDDIIGAELGGVFGPFHAVGEAQWIRVKAYRAGDTLAGLDFPPPVNASLVPSGDPSFFSWYAEAGYFLTGETRGYRNGLWDRTKVLHPLSKGGSGAVQLNARYDYLDLNSRAIQQGFRNDFSNGNSFVSNDLSRGGIQTGYLASLIWIPEDYVRFLVQLARTKVQGGPFAATVRPASTEPLDQRSYGVNSVAMRAQVDF